MNEYWNSPYWDAAYFKHPYWHGTAIIVPVTVSSGGGFVPSFQKGRFKKDDEEIIAIIIAIDNEEY